MEKAGALLLGTIFALVILEIALMIVGEIHEHPADSPGGITDAKTAHTIVFLGDSFTEGVGAPENGATADHFRRLLRNAFGETAISVVNRGRSGQNTTTQIRSLPETLDGIHPDVVVLLLGACNYWDYYGYYSYVQKGERLSTLLDMLQRVRVFRLAKLFYLGIVHDERFIGMDTEEFESDWDPDPPIRLTLVERDPCFKGAGWNLLYQGEDKVAAAWFRQAILKDPSDSYLYTGLATAMEENNRPLEAETWFRKGVGIDSGNGHNYTGIARIRMGLGDYKGALLWFDRALERRSPDARTLWRIGRCHEWLDDLDEAVRTLRRASELDPQDYDIMSALGLVMAKRGECGRAVDYFGRALGIAPTARDTYQDIIEMTSSWCTEEQDRRAMGEVLKGISPPNERAASVLELLGQEHGRTEISEWLSSELEDIFRLVIESGAKIVLQNYPSNHPANKVIERLASTNGYPLVDNLLAFDRLRRGNRAMERYLQPDGHCTSEGYEIIAENVLATLRDSGLLNELTSP